MSLEEAIQRKILLLDGAMGTMLIHHLGKLESLDEVTLLNPEEVERIHRAYSEAGADILKTNTFNNSSHTKKAVELVRRSKRDDQFIAGVIGPVLKEVPLEKIIDDFNESKADVLLLETCMSLQDTKERIKMISRRSNLPLMVSMTLTQKGNALSGESAQYFFDTIATDNILSFGFNCSYGPESITDVARTLKNPKSIPLSAHPNKKNQETFFNELKLWKEENLFRMIGGCCGTTPEDIKKIRDSIL